MGLPGRCSRISGSELKGRKIWGGRGRGRALVTPGPLNLLSDLDPDTGRFCSNHPLAGTQVRGRVLVFPTNTGSTVGSYVLYGLARSGHAPAALVARSVDAIAAAGAVIASIPAVSRVDISQIADGEFLDVDADAGIVRRGHGRK